MAKKTMYTYIITDYYLNRYATIKAMTNASSKEIYCGKMVGNFTSLVSIREDQFNQLLKN